ncbi:hypothetical protein ACE1TF_14860 [Geomicrobium sp. JSM 1781026]|uniref:hypothetical protein n=1 Tax=Geomicrobium sp. JSM 1781026 TaxID=3344580 RepID=UPI0035C00D52
MKSLKWSAVTLFIVLCILTVIKLYQTFTYEYGDPIDSWVNVAFSLVAAPTSFLAILHAYVNPADRMNKGWFIAFCLIPAVFLISGIHSLVLMLN